MKKICRIILFLTLVINIYSCMKQYNNEWVESFGKKYYYDVNGEKLVNCYREIDGDIYFFDDKGHLLTDTIVTYDDGKGLVWPNGKLIYRTGKCLFKDNWYYLTNGKIYTGKRKEGGNWYFFNKDGIMVTGWHYDRNNNSYVYLDKSGKALVGWQNIDGKWYYFDESTICMYTGWQKIDNNWYYFDKVNGYLITNQWIANNYYVNENGEMLNNGWHNVSGQMLFFESDGSVNRNRNYESEIKQKQSNGSNNKTSSNGLFAKKSIMAGSINNILNIVYPIWKEFRASTNYADKLVKSKLLESYGNSLCDICESAYSIDKISNNIEGMEEDQLFWRLGLTYIGANKWE